jgi:hypothetical protein
VQGQRARPTFHDQRSTTRTSGRRSPQAPGPRRKRRTDSKRKRRKRSGRAERRRRRRRRRMVKKRKYQRGKISAMP